MRKTESLKNNEGIWLTKEEYTQIEKDLVMFSDFQRLSSVLLWISIAMVILHIFADIFFHIT